MAARRVRVCVQYIRPAPCPFWPPSPPTWIPAVAGIYMFHLDYLLLFQTCRVAMLFRGLGRFLPCLSPSFSFSALPSASILLLIFFLPSPFFCYMILFSFIHFISICSSRILYVYLTESDCQKGQANGGRTGESGCVDVCKYFFFALYEFRLWWNATDSYSHTECLKI